jgi:hypothetical protein
MDQHITGAVLATIALGTPAGPTCGLPSWTLLSGGSLSQPHVTIQEKRQALQALHFYAVYDKDRPGVVEMGFTVSHLPHIIHPDEDA